MDEKYKSLKDKFLGCIYGLAIGDALGFPVEFFKLNGIYKRYPEGIKDFEPYNTERDQFPKGSYSDDTQMSLSIANALIKSKTDNIEEIMNNVTKESS
jgi:poly(ADP-ribose) glycohydrolase ARH3